MGYGAVLLTRDGTPASAGLLRGNQGLRAAGGAALVGALISLGTERLRVHGYRAATQLTVAQLADLWRAGNSAQQIGTAFELTVKATFDVGHGEEYERLAEALQVIGFGEVHQPAALLFGPEKESRLGVTSSAKRRLTERSRVWAPGRWMPLLDRLDALITAHRTQGRAGGLPATFRDLWRADVLLGCRIRDEWVGVSCKARRDQVDKVGTCIPLAVAPGSPAGRGDKRPFTMLAGMRTVSFPLRGQVWSDLDRAGTALRDYMAADGRIGRIPPTHAEDLRLLLTELDARRDELVTDVADDWLQQAGAKTARIWVPRRITPLAA